MNNHLAHRTSQVIASLEKASTPREIANARRAGLSIKAELEKNQTDDAALAMIKLAQKNPGNVLKALGVVRDHPVFMVRTQGSAGNGVVDLADGTKVQASQGIIPVPANLVPAMTARGWRRMNDDTMTSLHTTLQAPPPSPGNS